jgi:hypothetical protein
MVVGGRDEMHGDEADRRRAADEERARQREEDPVAADLAQHPDRRRP